MLKMCSKSLSRLTPMRGTVIDSRWKTISFLLNEKYVALFLDAEIWLAVNTVAGKDAASHTVQASSCALHALFAFLLLDEA